MAAARLEVIYGCMFAGKTTELIRRLSEARASGLTVAAIKPRSDTRSGTALLRTHSGATIPAAEVHDASDIPSAAGTAQVIGIDEAHFFGHALAAILPQLPAQRIIIAGVHLDHRGQAFDPFPQLLPIANDALQLFAPCAVCGKPAIHSHRKQNCASQDRIIVGGADLYEPRCAACFP